ncbi:MAG: alpha/beta hydrolase [Akkermansiaceae bacterium]|jgi:acetyl esterase/lipase|tara:strand:+ start:24310 stop:25221 length:912 start_codon:yes stop_codon:yes gene_type:complete
MNKMNYTRPLTMFCLLSASILMPLQVSRAEDEPERVALWEKQAPVGDGKTEAANAFITVHRPKKKNGTTVIICPGGGYGGLVKGAEGHGIAKWLNQHGIVGVVLEYRLPKGKAYRPLYDAQRAIRLIRSKAGEWNCNPKRIGIIGFSAGGHLASSAATHFDPEDAATLDPDKKISCRPDFAVLVYPVITMGAGTHGGSKRNLLGKTPDDKMIKLFSNELQVTKMTPPSFLAHAADDRVVIPGNSKMFYDALKANKVPSEYLKLASGGHGLNGYKGPMWDAWQTKSLQWLASLGMIPKNAIIKD